MSKIIEVEGIGPVYAEKLGTAGVATTADLIGKGATPAGRKALATATGISETLILEWTNHVDLMRIKGVASEYADLLEAAGVDTVPELAQRKAENLSAKLTELNTTKQLVRRVPTTTEVAAWIAEAKTLPRLLHY